MTWIRAIGWNESELLHRPVARLWNDEVTKGIVRSTSTTHIVVPVSRDDAGWECFATNSGSAVKVDDQMETLEASGEFDVIFTGFFSVTALLHGILTRRPGLVHPRFDSSSAHVPNYSYHLAGVYEAGRTVEILILFSVGPAGKGCIGVWVAVDLYTSDYQEQEFIRHTAYDTPPSSCASLAFERRRLHQSNGSERRGSFASMDRTSILATLYPDCETIDNVAVRRQQPVLSMKARDAPVEVVYG